MSTHESRLLAAWRRSGLAFLGISFERAMQIAPIRISLECAVKNETKGQPAPSQPALI